MDLKLYRQLAQIEGISSFEEEVSKFLETQLDIESNDIYYDKIGSLIVRRNSNKSKLNLMFATHIDEVGFIVSDIKKNFLKLQQVGSFWTHLVVVQLYTLVTRDGRKYRGIISSPASHGLPQEKRDKTLSMDDLYLDLGIEEEDIKNLGIEIGNMVCPYSPEVDTANGVTFISKAIDNRISAYIGLEVMKDLELNNAMNLSWAFTVQEEPGLRGARTSTEMVKPHVGLAIDTTLAGDGVFDKNTVSLGSGVVLSYIDSNSIAHRGFMRWIEDICIENNIKYQYAVFNKGGTDSGNIHKAFDGVINLSLAIPVRYMHTNHTIASKKDVDECIRLVKEIVRRLDDQEYEQLWEN